MFYSPIFGICFQLPIICAEERIHITKSKEPDSTGDLLNLDSDAEHQSEKSEHPVQLKSTGIRFLQETTRRKQLFGVSAGYGMDSIFGPLEISLGYSNQTDKGSCFVNLGYYFQSNLVKKNIITLQGRQILAILLRVIQYFQKAKEETASQ